MSLLLDGAQDAQKTPLQSIFRIDQELREPGLRMIPDLFIPIQLRSIARQVAQSNLTLALLPKVLHLPRRVIGRIVGNDHDGPPASASSFLSQAMNFAEFIFPSMVAKRMSPRGLTAEIRFLVKRSPLSSTTGVCPMAPHVCPRG